MENFKELALLYTELQRRDVEHYCLCNPHTQNAFDIATNNLAPRSSKKLMEIIYGKELIEEFIKEFENRKKVE